MNHCVKEEEYETLLYAAWVRSMVHTCYVRICSNIQGLSVIVRLSSYGFMPLDMYFVVSTAAYWLHNDTFHLPISMI